MAGKMEQTLERISNGIYSLQKGALLFLVSAITLINLAQIAGRYLFHFSLPWSEQLSVLLFIVIIMLGGSIAIRNDSEIKIAILKFKNPRTQQYFSIAVDLISLITIIFFVYASVGFFTHSLKYRQLVSSMQISYSYVFFFLPAGFALMGVEKLFHLIRKIIALQSLSK